MHESIVFCSIRVRCRRTESSRSLSHLLMSFLSYVCTGRRIAMTELTTIVVKVLSAVVLPTILLYSARGGKCSLI